MKFLADEGVDRAVVEAIRRAGHDVRWMAEESEGTKDDAVLAAADRDGLILITEDKDFGDLVYRQHLHHRGVVLIRIVGISNIRKGRIVAQAILAHANALTGAFTVIQHSTIRIRRP
jgi:predicted nuclease of predicted toxin-antitoxin system